MKNYFFGMIVLLAGLGFWKQAAHANVWPIASEVSGWPVATVPEEIVTHPPIDGAAAPVVMTMPPARTMAYPQRAYLLWPAVSFGFGFGHPFVSGYDRGDPSHSDSQNRR